MITDYSVLDKYVINDRKWMDYVMSSPSKLPTLDAPKVIWLVNIHIQNNKVYDNYIYPIVVKKLKTKYVFSVPNEYWDEKFDYIKNSIHNVVPRGKVGEDGFLYDFGCVNGDANEEIIKWKFMVFETPVDANIYRRQMEKMLRSTLANKRKKAKENTVTLEDIAEKFNININDLIIEGIWNDEFNKKRKKI